MHVVSTLDIKQALLVTAEGDDQWIFDRKDNIRFGDGPPTPIISFTTMRFSNPHDVLKHVSFAVDVHTDVKVGDRITLAAQ